MAGKASIGAEWASKVGGKGLRERENKNFIRRQVIFFLSV